MVGRSKKSGFTLIELLVVIAIIGLLSSVVLASLNTARIRARDASRAASISQFQTALELYYLDHGEYPESGGAFRPNAVWSTSTDDSWDTLEAVLAPYISQLPVDPKQSPNGWPGTAGVYSYSYLATASGCGLKYYMVVWRPEGTVPSPGHTMCNGSVINYPGTVTMGKGTI